MATHRLQLTTVPLWSIIGRLCCGLTLLIPLLVTACTATSAPPLSRQLARTNQLVQPLSLDELYRATPPSRFSSMIRLKRVTATARTSAKGGRPARGRRPNRARSQRQ